MKIAVAQINVTVGDFAGNAAKIRHAVDAARAAGARLVVTPEMALSGYPAEDLWLRDDFCDQCTAELVKLASYCLDVAVVVGYPHREGRTRYNAAAVLRGVRRLLVSGDSGELHGVVSLDDVLGALGHEMAELAHAVRKGIEQESAARQPLPPAAPPRPLHIPAYAFT